MKAYVIKNKEGKYFCGYDAFAGINVFSERVVDGLNTQTPTLQQCMEEIEYFHLSDCEVVEITIAEGVLEQELAIYKQALELACYYMEYKYPKQDDDIYYRKAQELEMIFMKQAKEKLEKEKNNGKLN